MLRRRAENREESVNRLETKQWLTGRRVEDEAMFVKLFEASVIMSQKTL
jgi:hypothetical protein